MEVVNKIKPKSFLFYKRIFLKLLAFIYLSAFGSIFVQIPALFGPDGLLPVKWYLMKIHSNFPGRLGFFSSIFTASEEINYVLIKFLPFLDQYDAYDNVLHIICLIAIFISLGILMEKETRYFNNMFSFMLLWFFYFSFFTIGQVFLSYQWDSMLLEVGFLAIFFHSNFNDVYDDEINIASRHLLKWLAFRLYISSGLVKLLSNCSKWWNLTALDYYFQTQYIPHFLSWTAHNYIPRFIKRFIVAGNFYVLIFIPLFFFFPYKPLRYMAGFYQIFMQISIILTGNYNFFNVLSITITLSLFEDSFLIKFCPNLIKNLFSIPSEKKNMSEINEKNQSFNKTIILNLGIQILLIWTFFHYYFPLNTWYYGKKVNFDMTDVRFAGQYCVILGAGFFIIDFFSNYVYIIFVKTTEHLKKEGKIIRICKGLYGLLFFIFIFSSSLHIFSASVEVDLSRYIAHDLDVYFKESFDISNKLHIVNQYGLLHKITGVEGRPELIIEGSLDGKVWEAYEFHYKPGNLAERPKLTLTHQPRLDWQMSFAALEDKLDNEIWLIHLINKLFKNSENALTLIKYNPFYKSGPNFLRIHKYKYWFTNIAESRSQNEWWKRSFQSVYMGSLQKNDPNLLNFLKNYGFENFKENYPIHISQEIPMAELIFAFFLAMAFLNIVNSESKE